jgi:hypothetical protein
MGVIPMPWKYPPGVERKCVSGLAENDGDGDRRLFAAHDNAGLAYPGTSFGY